MDNRQLRIRESSFDQFVNPPIVIGNPSIANQQSVNLQSAICNRQ
jgi:hypothetical protein